MHSIIRETDVRQNFVSPALCSELKYAGFNGPHTFSWKVYPSDVILDTLIFDIDDYYKEGNACIDYITPLKETLPAWTIKELEKFLPDYTLCQRNNYYQISLDTFYVISSASRLPDAYAGMILRCIQKKIINPNQIAER